MAPSDQTDADTGVEIEMVSMNRGFRSVSKLKRWIGERLYDE